MSTKSDPLKDFTALIGPPPGAQTGQDSRYKSLDLFKGQTEIQIEHQGAEYRLRITRSGGLILNK